MSTLAIDLGGTRVKVGRVEDSTVVAQTTLDARSEQGLDQVLPRLMEVLRQMRTSDVQAVGLALPTLVDGRAHRVLADMKGKYEGLKGFDFVGWCRHELDLPLRMENDAHAALLGEWRAGSGTGCDDLVLITLGTGIGTSVLINGRCLRGRHGQAGNFGGHLVMDPAGFSCGCGGQGCVEAQQHLNVVVRLAKSDPAFRRSKLSEVATIDYSSLFGLRDHDDLARRLSDRSLDIWGSLVVSLIHQFDPQRVIVGGGILRSGHVILPHLQLFADRACTPWGRVQVVPATLGDQAALVGLASLFTYPPEYL